MNRTKLSFGRRFLVNFLPIGSIIFGIGCVSWAMLSLWTQSNYFSNTTGNVYSSPTPFVAAAVKGAVTSSEPVLPTPCKLLYPLYPSEGDNIGSLTIPALNRKLPIIQGTGVKELKKGVGHFLQSVLPGEKDNCVFSGHRDTVFRQLGKLKIGDTLIVQTSAGVFTYKVTGTRIVHEDDKTVIVPTDHAVLTMTTCYPFNTPGYYPDRYIVSADLVKN